MQSPGRPGGSQGGMLSGIKRRLALSPSPQRAAGPDGQHAAGFGSQEQPQPTGTNAELLAAIQGMLEQSVGAQVGAAVTLAVGGIAQQLQDAMLPRMEAAARAAAEGAVAPAVAAAMEPVLRRLAALEAARPQRPAQPQPAAAARAAAGGAAGAAGAAAAGALPPAPPEAAPYVSTAEMGGELQHLVAAGPLVEAGTPGEAVERLLRAAGVVVAYANARRVTAGGGGGGAASSRLLFTLTGGSEQRRALFGARGEYMAPRGAREAGEGQIWLLGQQMSPQQIKRRAALRASAAFRARLDAELSKQRRSILWVWDACAVGGEWWTVEYARLVDAANAAAGATPAAGGGAPPPAAAGAAGGPGAPDAAPAGGVGGGQSRRKGGVRRVGSQDAAPEADAAAME
ncbi:MAG: hypothetical protein J3K34DRAFT_478592, partial [Monoraphidium minutum]